MTLHVNSFYRGIGHDVQHFNISHFIDFQDNFPFPYLLSPSMHMMMMMSFLLSHNSIHPNSAIVRFLLLIVMKNKEHLL